MSEWSVVSQRYPRAARAVVRSAAGWNRIGSQMALYAETLGDVRLASIRYKTEIARLIAGMSLGVGTLAIIGGTLVIVAFLTLTTGSIIAVQGYNQLSGVGVEALTGFLAAYVNVRISAPVTASIALSATIGAGATAQLGAMRISEEIDALEAMGIKSVAYLMSTRVAAGVIVIIPLYSVCVLMNFLAAQLATTMIYGQPTGVYSHYFNTFLRPTDVIWSYFTVIVTAVAVMLVHSYYGYRASGGPAGVGEAVGRAVRTSMILGAFVILAVSLAVYGQSGNFDLSG